MIWQIIISVENTEQLCNRYVPIFVSINALQLLFNDLLGTYNIMNKPL